MEPGDQVFLSYEDYDKLIQADKQNKGLTDEIKDLKKINQDLTHQLQVAKQKLILKNAIICKEQFKTEYLMSLFDDINKSFGIKAEDIGKGLKFLKSMDETYFSVLKLPSEVDENEKLPDDFSKSNVYMEVDVQLDAYKNLAQVCCKQWNEKLKLIEYLETSMKTAENKDVKKIEEEAERKEKQLRAENEELKCEKMQLRVELVSIQNNYKSLQALNVEMQKKLQQMSLCSSSKQQQFKNDIQDLKMRLDHESLKNSQNQKKLKEETSKLEQMQNSWKQMVIHLEVKEKENAEKLKMMQMKENQLIDQINMHESEKGKLKVEMKSLYKEIEDLRRFAQISSEKVETLQNEVQTQQNEILSLRRSTPTNDHITDIKQKLFSLISEYIIYLNKSLMQMNLTSAEKKSIIKSEVSQVEQQFGKELKKLQF